MHEQLSPDRSACSWSASVRASGDRSADCAGKGAVTLQGADRGGTTTLDETLGELGMAVAELAGREAELHPEDRPRVNLNGIEELGS